MINYSFLQLITKVTMKFCNILIWLLLLAPATMAAVPSTLFISAAASTRSSLTSRAALSEFQEVASNKGMKHITQIYNYYISKFNLPIFTNFSNNVQLCPTITRSVVDGCKQGVRGQAAICKQAIRDIIATCKTQARHDIDNCKKNTRFFWKKADCESKRPGLMLNCERKRIDIPFCEVNRLTNVCCEGMRAKAATLCLQGISPVEIQKQIQSIQMKCSVAANIAKTALKSYLSGQIVGLISDISAVKEIGEGVKIFEKLQKTEKEFEKYADGLTAIATQNYDKAESSLISVLPFDAANTVQWASKVNAIVNGRVEGFLNEASLAAGDVSWIVSIKNAVDDLRNVQNNILVIKEAAEKCTFMKFDLFPTNYNWPEINSLTEVDNAVRDYITNVSQELIKMGRCKAVLQRAIRVTLA